MIRKSAIRHNRWLRHKKDIAIRRTILKAELDKVWVEDQESWECDYIFEELSKLRTEEADTDNAYKDNRIVLGWNIKEWKACRLIELHDLRKMKERQAAHS